MYAPSLVGKLAYKTQNRLCVAEALDTLIKSRNMTEKDYLDALDSVENDLPKSTRLRISPADGFDAVLFPECKNGAEIYACARSLSPGQWLAHSWRFEDFTQKHGRP